MRRAACLVLFLAVLSGCGTSTPTSPLSSSVTVAELEAAALSFTTGGQNLSVRAALSTAVALGQSAPVDGSVALDGTLVVFPVEQSALTAQVTATRAWIVRGSAFQEISFTTRRDAATYSLDFTNGPKWGPSGAVDVVVALDDGTTTRLLRAASQPIATVQTGAAAAFASVPSSVSLAGATLTLSSFLSFNYCCNSIPPVNLFSGSITVITDAGSAPPAGVRATQIWIVLSDRAWTTTGFSVSSGTTQAPAYRLGLPSATPAWGPATVDVVVALTDGVSTVMVRQTGIKIFPTYSV